jgi:pimeloyl-ACP methyl ester carboxylesterase
MLDLSDINLFAQDWGAVIGLRIVGLNPDLFKTVTIGNGFFPNLPAGTTIYPPVENPNEIEDIPSIFTRYTPQQVPYYDNCVRLNEEFDFTEWMFYAMKASSFQASEVLEGWTWFDLSPEVEAAYDAPFPGREYMAGARMFPSLLNEVPGLTQDAWMGLARFQRPFLTIWGANDPLDLGECQLQQALIDNIPGAANQPHHRFPDASHYLQDDQGQEIAHRLIEFYKSSTANIGFEILQMVSSDEIITWKNISEMSVEEFEAIDLPFGWFKNQPREGEADSGVFARSPGTSVDGEFTDQEHFGYLWRHVATIRETNIELDEQGLLSGNRIDKYHELTFNAGRTLNILISPEDDRYVRVSRDYGRSSDDPTIPGSWNLVEEVITEDLVIQLPNPTLNIRTDNEDSFQGPIQ